MEEPAGLGGLLCRSFHRPGSSFMFSNEDTAKISIKLPETLKSPHRLHTGMEKEVSWSRLQCCSRESFLGHKW